MTISSKYTTDHKVLIMDGSNDLNVFNKTQCDYKYKYTKKFGIFN